MRKGSTELITSNDLIESMPCFFDISCKEISDFIKMLDEATLRTMLFTFQQEEIFIDKKIGLSEKDILFKMNLTPNCNVIILRWLAVLKEGEYIYTKDSKYYLNKDILLKELDISELWNKMLDKCDERICSKRIIEYFFNNAKSLKAFMDGEEHPTFILFPKGEFKYADALYSDLVIAKYLNLYLAHIVTSIIEKKTENFKILEVGGGTGSTTKIVLNSLSKNNQMGKVNYVFTDLSRFFLNNAKYKFKNYSSVEYKIIDIDKNLEDQHIGNDSVDIMIAVGVLNNSKNMKHTLDSFSKVLKEDGYLLVIESVVEFKVMLISQAFMMEPPNDERKKTNSTFLNVKQWENQFCESGFEILNILPFDNHKLAQFGQRLFLLKKSKI
ncbi:class I SAM-dependent methyltransferase [Haloimpatiens sp. FM7330]|uniref:class I SAM-dependent methyltransferase n=1 Tax=Haloimpatiens sp. FM7330 TaxID=3298610 RepID=UPI0036387B13